MGELGRSPISSSMNETTQQRGLNAPADELRQLTADQLTN
jgi:hypothetical protein